MSDKPRFISAIDESIHNNINNFEINDSIVLFCAGGYEKITVSQKNLRILQTQIRAQVIGIVGEHTIDDETRTWAALTGKFKPHQPVPFDLTQLEASAQFLLDTIAQIAPHQLAATVGFSQGAVVAMLAQMQQPSMGDVIAVCPGFVAGMNYTDAHLSAQTGLSMIHVEKDHCTSRSRSDHLTEICRATAISLPNHQHIWSEQISAMVAAFLPDQLRVTK